MAFDFIKEQILELTQTLRNKAEYSKPTQNECDRFIKVLIRDTKEDH